MRHGKVGVEVLETFQQLPRQTVGRQRVLAMVQPHDAHVLVQGVVAEFHGDIHPPGTLPHRLKHKADTPTEPSRHRLVDKAKGGCFCDQLVASTDTQ